MSGRARAGFALIAALPLLAPYELMVRPDWSDAHGVAWGIALLVSLGAMGVSAFLLLVAVMGLNRRVVFDPAVRKVAATESHLLQLPRTRVMSFADLSGVAVICHDWSDGPSTYELELRPRNGAVVRFGEFSTRAEAEAVRDELAAMCGVQRA